MKRTVELDPEGKRPPESATRRCGQSFEQGLDQALVAGVADREDAGADEAPFVVKSSPMRLLAHHDATQHGRIDDRLEAQAFAELTARLEKRSG